MTELTETWGIGVLEVAGVRQDGNLTQMKLSRLIDHARQVGPFFFVIGGNMSPSHYCVGWCVALTNSKEEMSLSFMLKWKNHLYITYELEESFK